MRSMFLRHNTARRRASRGLTLIETMIALTVSTAAVAAGLIIGHIFYVEAQVRQDVSTIEDVFAATNKVYQNQAGYLGLTMTALNTAGALPLALANQTTYNNKWGGTFTLSVANSASGTNDIAVLTSTDVPQSGCSGEIARLAPYMYDTSVNGSIVPLTPAEDANGWERYQINAAAAAGLCKSTNTLVFRILQAPIMWADGSFPFPTTLFAGQSTWVATERARYLAAMNAREAVQAAL